jgi:hypothetical protein
MADDEVNEQPQESLLSQEQHEEEVEQEEEEEPVPAPTPVSEDSFRAMTLRVSQQFGFQALLFLHFAWTLLCRLGSATATVSTSIVRSLQSHMYVFFQGTPFPYRLQEFTVSGPGVPPIEWYYDADKKIFLSANLYNTSTEYTLHHFEWLTGQVKYNDLLLQDITEYLQEAKWAGTTRPTPAVILSAWSLHSGTVLHLSEGLRLHTINQDATESVLPIRGTPT